MAFYRCGGGNCYYLHKSWELSDNTKVNSTFTATSKCNALIDMRSNYGSKKVYVNNILHNSGNVSNINIELKPEDVLKIEVTMDSGGRIGLVSCTIVSSKKITNSFS